MGEGYVIFLFQMLKENPLLHLSNPKAYLLFRFYIKELRRFLYL